MGSNPTLSAMTVMTQKLSPGILHEIPSDMRKAILASPETRVVWEDITPIARNEWICWTISVKKEETRAEHIERMIDMMAHGKRRPCCWPGCPHRKKHA